MYSIHFVALFREQALAETRTLTTRGDAALPDDDYALAEAYCGDPQCACRRVMLNILGRRQGHVVTIRFGISFGFDRDDELAGTFLDPLKCAARVRRGVAPAGDAGAPPTRLTWRGWKRIITRSRASPLHIRRRCGR